jgi:hypothetical protein
MKDVARPRIHAHSREQLALLRAIAAILKRAKVRFWLRGGWALDFTLGRVTRLHGDIDLATWKRNRGLVQRLFTAHGLRTTRETASNVWFQRNGVEVAVDFIVKAEDDTIKVAGFERGEPLFVDDSPLKGPPRVLDGIVCRVFSVEGLIRQIEMTPAWLGRPPREKDIASLAALKQLRRENDGTNPSVG